MLRASSTHRQKKYLINLQCVNFFPSPINQTLGKVNTHVGAVISCRQHYFWWRYFTFFLMVQEFAILYSATQPGKWPVGRGINRQRVIAVCLPVNSFN